MSRAISAKIMCGAVGIVLSLTVAVSCSKSSKNTVRRGELVTPSSTVDAAASNAQATNGDIGKSIKTVLEPHFVAAREVKDDVQEKFLRSHASFALTAYRRLASGQPDNNFVFSPASLQLALGMLVVGARGGGENRLARITAPGVKPERIYEVMQSWQEQLLRSMNSPSQPGVERVGVLSFANSLWLDDSIQPASTFVEKLGQYYGFGVFRVPIRGAASTASLAVNQWVSDRTEGRIARMTKNVSSKDTALLVSAVYIKTKFASPFGSIEPEPFSSKSGSKTTVHMMRNVLRTRAIQTRAYQAIELDLLYGATSLIALMPMAGPLDAFTRGLTASKWLQVLNDLEHNKKNVDLHLPKTDLRSRFDNIESALGLPEGPIALPFVAPTCQVTAFPHEATFVANKDGVEVPTAAGTTMQSGSSGQSKEDGSIVARFDRPYVFAIVHRLTGSILLLGQVAAP